MKHEVENIADKIYGKLIEIVPKYGFTNNSSIVGRLVELKENGLIVEKPLKYILMMFPSKGGMIQITTMFLPFVNTGIQERLFVPYDDIVVWKVCEDTVTFIQDPNTGMSKKIYISELYEQKLKEILTAFSGIEIPDTPKEIKEELRIIKKNEDN